MVYDEFVFRYAYIHNLFRGILFKACLQLDRRSSVIRNPEPFGNLSFQYLEYHHRLNILYSSLIRSCSLCFLQSVNSLGISDDLKQKLQDVMVDRHKLTLGKTLGEGEPETNQDSLNMLMSTFWSL